MTREDYGETLAQVCAVLADPEASEDAKLGAAMMGLISLPVCADARASATTTRVSSAVYLRDLDRLGPAPATDTFCAPAPNEPVPPIWFVQASTQAIVATLERIARDPEADEVNRLEALRLLATAADLIRMLCAAVVTLRPDTRQLLRAMLTGAEIGRQKDAAARERAELN